jgi:hypothetical protein
MKKYIILGSLPVINDSYIFCPAHDKLAYFLIHLSSPEENGLLDS